MPASTRSYNAEEADRIIDMFADGCSWVQIADNLTISKKTIRKWLRDNEEFRQRYLMAKGEWAESMLQEILEIADDRSRDPMCRRASVDTRKWILQKVLPKFYGEHARVEVTGAEGGPVQHVMHVHFGKGDDAEG